MGKQVEHLRFDDLITSNNIDCCIHLATHETRKNKETWRQQLSLVPIMSHENTACVSIVPLTDSDLVMTELLVGSYLYKKYFLFFSFSMNGINNITGCCALLFETMPTEIGRQPNSHLCHHNISMWNSPLRKIEL